MRNYYVKYNQFGTNFSPDSIGWDILVLAQKKSVMSGLMKTTMTVITALLLLSQPRTLTNICAQNQARSLLPNTMKDAKLIN
jgi:hypothetical protein